VTDSKSGTNPEYSSDAEEAQHVSSPEEETPQAEPEALSADLSYDAEPAEDESAPATQPAITRSLSDKPIQTVGRRKEAVVRVRLVPGNGKFLLNGKDLATYFPNKLHQQLIKDPFLTVEKVDGFDVFARLHGGGISGQAGALRLAIARALIIVNADDRPALKAAGFLTRDSRAIERKKYGLKKARKAPQYSKR
jgi:small subunit ribosomal protein S9